MRKALVPFVLAVAFIVTAALPAAAETVDFEAMLKQIDTINDFSGLDFSGVFTIVSDKPGEKQSMNQVRMFRRDTKDQFLMLIQLPDANKGQGYLKEGDNMWFYDPTSKKFSHSSLKENLSDSEAKNSDFSQKSILEDYAIQKTEEGAVGKIAVWIITLKARTNEVSYDAIKIFVRKDRPLVLKQEDLSVSGRLMRTTLYPKYADIGKGKLYPSQMLIVDEVNVGEKSLITMTEMTTATLPDKVFTKAFLEQVN